MADKKMTSKGGGSLKAAKVPVATPAATTAPAVDWSLLSNPSSSSSTAVRSTDQTIRSLLTDIHELQLERANAAAVHATNASQIAALTANLQDAIVVQQQMQTKIQLLEYGLQVERRQN